MYVFLLLPSQKMQEQINDLAQRMDESFEKKHNENSKAIDDIVVSMLGGDNNV